MGSGVQKRSKIVEEEVKVNPKIALLNSFGDISLSWEGK